VRVPHGTKHALGPAIAGGCLEAAELEGGVELIRELEIVATVGDEDVELAAWARLGHRFAPHPRSLADTAAQATSKTGPPQRSRAGHSDPRENRPRYNRDHLRYPSDLTEDWEEAERVIVALKTAIEQARRGEPDSRVLSLRILGGLHHLYVRV